VNDDDTEELPAFAQQLVTAANDVFGNDPVHTHDAGTAQAVAAVLRVLAETYQSASDEVDGTSEHWNAYRQALAEVADGLCFNAEQLEGKRAVSSSGDGGTYLDVAEFLASLPPEFDDPGDNPWGPTPHC
jgi:hypothetical protein